MGACETRQKTGNAVEVSGRVDIEGVPMPALQLHVRLGLPGRIEQAAAMRRWNDLVSRRMQEELRDSDAGHLVDGAETASGDPADGYIGIELLAPIDRGGESALHNEPRHG